MPGRGEYVRVQGDQRRFIKAAVIPLLSHRDNLDLDGRKALKTLLAANKRLNTAYLLNESFGQLWDYEREDGRDASSRTGRAGIVPPFFAKPFGTSKSS